MKESDAVDAIARLTGAIGASGFAPLFLDAMRALSGSELCSAFAFDRSGPPKVLLAQGWLPLVPAFAQKASADYAREFWRRDLVGQRLRHRHRPGAIEIFKVTASGIGDAEHRRECYERASVGQRLSILQTGEPGLLVSGYRTTRSGPFTIDDVDWTERFAPLMVSALRRHLALDGALAPSGSSNVQMLLDADFGLTPREAQVAAGLAEGAGQAEIGERSGLALSSVVTYRRRAYRKLAIANRRQLRQLLQTLRS